MRVSLPRLVGALVLLCVALGSFATPALALDPTLRISQYGHQSWRTGYDGLATAPESIAQNPSGYIVIGGQDGLYRFDGRSFRRFQPWAGSGVAVHTVTGMHYAPDGTLYLGFNEGFGRYRNGRFQKFAKSLESVSSIFEDARGRTWFGRIGWHGPRNDLCRIDGDRLACRGTADGSACATGQSAATARDGSIWSVSEEGVICRLGVDGRETSFTGVAKQVAFQQIVTDVRRGRLFLMGAPSFEFDRGRWRRLEDGGLGRTTVSDAFVDRAGAIWIGSLGEGIYRIFRGRVDHFGRAEGLSGSLAKGFVEDREGSVWVITDRGVDQFRALPVLRYGTGEGLSGDVAANAFTAPGGDIWIANSGGIDVVRRDGVRHVPWARGLGSVSWIAHDAEGQPWIEIAAGDLLYGKGLKKVRQDPGRQLRPIFAMAPEPNGDVWGAAFIGDPPRPLGRLYRMRRGVVVEEVRSPAEADEKVINALAADGTGGLWLAVYGRGAFRYSGGRFTRLPVPGQLVVTGFALTGPSRGWVSTREGLFHVGAGGGAFRVSVANGLRCDTFLSIVRDVRGDLWLKAVCGLMRITAAEQALLAVDHAARIDPLLIDAVDGAPMDVEAVHAAASADGRVAFVNNVNAFVVDAARGSFSPLPPPVVVEDLRADDRSVLGAGITPTNPRRVEFAFAGLGFSRPDLMRFRYVMSSGPRRWSGTTAEPTVSFTDLGPGRYVFSVVACAAPAVCSDHPAIVAFEVPPTFWQSWLFKGLCLAMALVLGWVAYRVRMGQVARGLRLRMEARIGERERIARDLHDTLLQGFQGLLLRIQSVANRMPREAEGRFQLEDALSRAEDAVVEGRDRVRQLRMNDGDLVTILRAFVDDAEPDCRSAISLVIEGAPRSLRPGVANELGQAAREALGNACRHAAADRIELTAFFHAGELVVSVSDDGRGLQASSEGPERLHFGLVGMRERMGRLGGAMSLRSGVGEGVEVTFRVPARVAYAGTRRRRLRTLFRSDDEMLAL